MQEEGAVAVRRGGVADPSNPKVCGEQLDGERICDVYRLAFHALVVLCSPQADGDDFDGFAERLIGALQLLDGH